MRMDTDPESPTNKPRLGSSFPSGRFMMKTRKKIPKLDDVRSNGWLEAMISSSPPRKRLVKDFNVEVAPEDDFAQRAWMLKYPSAITSFGHIAAQAKDKKIAMFLDYDGTLSPIVDDPDRAIMSDACLTSASFFSLSLPKSLNKRESERKTADFFIFCSSLTMSRNKQEEDPRINGIKTKIRVVPDFPKKGNFFFCIFLKKIAGIMFQDITTVLLDPKAFKDTIDLFVERYRDKNISVVAGIISNL
ncbi:hypothetical protein F2Q68_00037274 [Brassica cretica]|uniref:Trehalose 6-phosphate phosphatase n=1 Tax=Brassica cretica TaxID=69181 RepID=A0A8S9H7J7_BRACR|nr:hypothetical protein F2Q68_00037274 [Brassica cretica]